MPSSFSTLALDILNAIQRRTREPLKLAFSLQDFIGPRQTVSSFACDGAKELYRAAVDLGLCPARHAHTFRSRIPLPSDKYGMSRKVPAHCSNSTVLHLHSGHTRLDAFASPRTRGITKPDPPWRNATREDPSQAFAYLSDHQLTYFPHFLA